MISLPLLTDFLKISNYITLIALILLSFAFVWMRKLEKDKQPFRNRMTLGLIVGLIIGIGIDLYGATTGVIYTDYAQSEISAWFAIFGSGFIRLIQLLAIPVVFLSIIEVITRVDGKNLKNLTQKTFATLLGTTAISALITGIILKVIPLDVSGFAGDIAETRTQRIAEVSTQSFPEFFLDLIPNNVFAILSDNGKIVSVVIMAALFSSALRFLMERKPREIAPVVKLLESLRIFTNSILINVIKLMPYGIVALVANAVIANGLEIILGLINFIVVLYIAVAVMLIIYIFLLLGVGVNPIQFYKKAYTTQVFAFSSRSSVGTLPYTLATLKDMGVSEKSGNFVATLATSIGMNGCAGIFPAMLGIILAEASGMTLDLSFYVMLIIVVTIGSIGIAGVPGTATVAATVTLNSLGLGGYISQIGAVFGIDPIIDMGRTMLNVTGAMVSAIIVDRWEGTFDQEQFNQPPADLEIE